jgi:hypothetical protein
MKKLTAEDLLALKYGDSVYRYNEYSNDMLPLKYVARMPGNEDYLIFCAGEVLLHLYIHIDGTFKNEWFSGDFNIDVVDELEIKRLEKRLDLLKERSKTIKR